MTTLDKAASWDKLAEYAQDMRTSDNPLARSDGAKLIGMMRYAEIYRKEPNDDQE